MASWGNLLWLDYTSASCCFQFPQIAANSLRLHCILIPKTSFNCMHHTIDSGQLSWLSVELHSYQHSSKEDVEGGSWSQAQLQLQSKFVAILQIKILHQINVSPPQIKKLMSNTIYLKVVADNVEYRYLTDLILRKMLAEMVFLTLKIYTIVAGSFSLFHLVPLHQFLSHSGSLQPLTK